MNAKKLSQQIFDDLDYNLDTECVISKCDKSLNTKKSSSCDNIITKIVSSGVECATESDLLTQLDDLKTRLSTLPVTHLSNADFLAGTYRIRNPGTYIIDEDIEFNPTGTGGQPPGVGWFATIGVETTDVLIDLAGHELKESTAFLKSHIANVFSHIELDNSPFAGNAQGAGFAAAGSTYPDQTRYVAAKNVWIKNGSLAQSGHWGIHGNNNSGIFLQNLRIYDWEVAGITLNGLTNSYLTDLDISGNAHSIPVRGLQLNIALIQGGLASFGTTGPIGTQAVAINNNLNTFITNNPDINAPLPFPDASVYGILIAGGSPFSEPFPLTPEACQSAIADTNGKRGTDIVIKNVLIHDITAAPLETIAVGSNNGGFLSLLGLGVFGMLRYADLFDSTGNFNPNPIARANAFVALQNLNSNNSSKFPSNLSLILQSILNNNSNLFFANAIPVFGRNFMSSVSTGVFGFRIDCGDSNIYLSNCSTNSIINLADPSIELADLPGASHFPNLIPEDNSGVDCWGYEFSSANDVNLQDCSAFNTRSENGDVFAFDMISSDTNIILNNCIANGVYGFGESATGASESYGYRFKNTKSVTFEQKCPYSGKMGSCVVKKACKNDPLNIISCSIAQNIVSKRVSFGFSNESTTRTFIDNSTSIHVVATSSLLTQSVQNPKKAYGFSSDSGLDNVFDTCTAIDTSILGEDDLKAPTTSVAAGFALLGTDKGTIIKDCISKESKTGAGVYSGILIEPNVKNETIINFKSCDNTQTAVYGQSHKILHL
jgi:hypothetical protein